MSVRSHGSAIFPAVKGGIREIGGIHGALGIVAASAKPVTGRSAGFALSSAGTTGLFRAPSRDARLAKEGTNAIA